MSTLRQTLYWAGNPTVTIQDNNATGCFEARGISAAESHDVNDGTYYGATCPDDFSSLNASADIYTERTIGSATTTYAISFVRVKIRGRVFVAAGPGSVTCSLSSRCSGVSSGGQLITSAFADYSFDLATDPADSQPWTNAKVNGKNWGFLASVNNTDATFTTTSSLRLSEYEIQLWGNDNITLNPARIESTVTLLTTSSSEHSNEAMLGIKNSDNKFGGDVLTKYELFPTNPRGVSSLGIPYFRFQTNSQYGYVDGFSSLKQSVEIVVRLAAAPVRKSSDREVHTLFCFHNQARNRTGMGIGVTPDLGVAFSSQFDPPALISAPKTLRVGARYVIRATTDGSSRRIYVNGTEVAFDTRAGVTSAAPVTSDAQLMMFFNDNTGLSRVKAEISGFNFYNTGSANFSYPFNEGSGLTVDALIDYNIDNFTGLSTGVTSTPAWPRTAAQMQLTPKFFIPPSGLVWGAIDFSAPPETGFTWATLPGFSDGGSSQSPHFLRSGVATSPYYGSAPVTPNYTR